MSETQGIHYQITGDASSFTAELNRAASALEAFAAKSGDLKAKEAALKENISSLTKEIEKKQQALTKAEKKLSQYNEGSNKNKKSAEALKSKITELKGEIDKLTTSLSANKSKLESVSSAQARTAQQVKSTYEQIERLSNSYEQNSHAATQNKNANESVVSSLKSGITAIKGFALGYAGKTLYNALIGSNAEFEQYLTSFEVLLQSSEKAEKLISDLDKLGAATPFELPDLTKASEQLLAFGTAEEDVMTRLNQLGDLSKGKADILERITLAYGKMQAKGKVSLEELNMMTEAGVPIIKELANQLNITTDALFSKITKGEINIKNINKAMEAMTGEGGQFFGMMEKQSQTMEGLLSTASDNINMALRDIGSGAFEALKDEVSGALAELQRMQNDGSLKEFASGVGDQIAVVVNVMSWLAKTVYNLRHVLLIGANAWIAYKGAAMVATTFKVLKGVLDGVKKSVTALSAAKKGQITIGKVLKSQTLAEMLNLKLETAAEEENTAAKNKNKAATTGAAVAQKGFNAVLKTHPAALAVAGLMLVVSAVLAVKNAINQAKEEQQRAAIQAGEDAQNQAKEVSDLVKEYKELAKAGDWDNSSRERAREIQQRLKELVGDEVQGLDDGNKKLEERLDILDDIQAKNARDNSSTLWDAEQAAGAELQKLIGKGDSFYITASSASAQARKMLIDSGLFYRDIVGNNVQSDKFTLNLDSKEQDEFHEFLDKYPKLIALKKELYEQNLQESKEYEELANIISKYEEKYNSYIKTLEAWQKNEAFVNLADYMKSNDIDSQEAFDTYINGVKESSEYSKQYKDILIDVANNAFPQFSGAAQEAGEKAKGAGDDTKKSIGEMIDSLKTVGDSLSALNEAQAELNKNGKLNVSTISEIKEKFAGLGSGLDEYINRLVKANGNSAETKKIFSEMTDALIEQTFSTEELAEADVNLIAQMLKEAGVSDSLAVATKLVNKAKKETELATLNFSASTEDEIKKLFSEAEAFGIAKEKIIELLKQKIAVNQTQIKTQSDIDEIIAMANAAGATASTLQRLAAVKAALAEETAGAAKSNDMSGWRGLGGKSPYDFGHSGRNKSLIEKLRNGEFNFEWEPLKASDYYSGSSGASYSGNTGSGKSGSKSSSKSTAASDFKKSKQKEDDKLARQLELDLGYDRISEEEYNAGQRQRAHNYRVWADEAKTNSKLTYEEQLEIYEDFIAKAEDLEVNAYKKDKSLREKKISEEKKGYEDLAKSRTEDFNQRTETSNEWISGVVSKKLYNEAYEGYERMRTYTNEFYNGEKQKLKEAYEAGLYTQEEYNKKANDLAKDHAADIAKINSSEKDTQDGEFDNYISTAKQYISDRNFYNDWDLYNDNEQSAWTRVFAKIDEFRNKGIEAEKWMPALAEISKTFYQTEYDKMQKAAENEKETLKEKYKTQYEMKKAAAEKELELAKSKAEKEKEAINETADNEIKRIDELIAKRKEAREDADYDLKLSRLRLKLEYENDEDNRRALEKEIKNLEKQRDDTLFDRQMEKLKEEAESKRDAALAKADKKLKEAETKADRAKKHAENKYNMQLEDDSVIAAIIKNKLNFGAYEEIANSFGAEYDDSLKRGIQAILSAVNSVTSPESGNSYDYSKTSKTYNLYANFKNASTPAQTVKALRKLIEQIELEARM